MMPNHAPESRLQEALIQFASSDDPPIERIVQLIEQAGGRVLHAYPPTALVAALAPSQIPLLRATDGIQAVDTDEVTDLNPSQAAGTSELAIAAWNEHVRSRRQQAPPNPSYGLPWDAPGYLAPDPPPEVRDELRRRERELQEEGNTQADEEDPILG